MFIVGSNALPSIILPGVMVGRHFTGAALNVVSIFVSTSLAALFVFFSLVAIQGLLLNLLPAKTFPGVSLVAQCALLIAILCGLPFVFSIPDLQAYITQRPGWADLVPPLWFLGLDQAILGNREPFTLDLARQSLLATLATASSAIGA